jgi:hypothetical protein
MRQTFILAAAIVALLLPLTTGARAAGCVADQYGGPVCGEGRDAVRVFDDTTSPSKKFAFAWRSSAGLPAGQQEPAGDIENVLVRLDDGAVIGKLGGEYWAIGTMRANRFEQLAAWSPDSRAVVEVANSRWDTNAFAYYAIDGDKVAKVDLLALVSPAVKSKVSASRRDNYAFRVRQDLGVTLDARGHLRFKAMLYVPKGEAELDFSIEVAIVSRGGAPSARIISMRRIEIDPRL